MRSNYFLATHFLAALFTCNSASVQARPPAKGSPVSPAANGAPTTDFFDRTPLMVAALKGDAAGVQALLARGARVNAKDRNGMTALMWGAPEVVPLLLKGGADVRARDNFGRTPLTYAAFREHPSTVTALLDRRAEVDARDNRGMTPLFWVIEGPTLRFWMGFTDFVPDRNIFEEFSKAGAQREAAVPETRATGVVSLLLEHGANPNARDDLGRTPLIVGSATSFIDLNGRGRSIVERLLAKGADVNARDTEGDTALMAAMEWPDSRMLELLLAHGADAKAKRRDGQTALSIASHAMWWIYFPKDREQVRSLLEAATNMSKVKQP